MTPDDRATSESHDTIVCLDALPRQRTKAEYRARLADVLRLARRRAVVAGYEAPPAAEVSGRFYHEPLRASIARLVNPDSIAVLSAEADVVTVEVDTAHAPAGSLLDGLRRTRVFDTPSGRFVSLEGDLISSQFEQFGGHTRGDLAMVLSLLDAGDAAVDVGAHIGSFAVPLARHVGAGGLVVAVEPAPLNIELLYQNIVGNDVVDRVVVVETVASDQAEPHRGVRDERNTGAWHFERDEAGVPGTAVDRLVDQALGHRRVRLLKVDVEGMELAVLRSAAATISASRPLIYCEVIDAHLTRQGVTLGALAHFFDAHDYGLYRNIGARNATDDGFAIARLASLADGGPLFDCLAVPAEQIGGLQRTRRLPV